MRLGLKRGSHWYAPIVRAILCSEFSHAAIEINGRIYESTALRGSQPKSGVRDYPLTDPVAADYVWLDLGIDDDDHALQAYSLVRGQNYDYFSLLAFLPFIRARDSRCAYCYELVGLMLGMNIVSRITPEVLLFGILKKKVNP